MRKDTSFSDRKLTTEEFSKKYWRGGKFPYQYHTGTIEDGRDEREQFVFNNIRAVWERVKFNNDLSRSDRARMWERILSNERKIKNIAFIAYISLVFVICGVLRNERG